jgi:hypothetical protein
VGWSSGHKIFDVVANCLVMDIDANDPDKTDFTELAEDTLYVLKCALEDQDWDSHQESDYYNHPVIGHILGNEFEDELEDELEF